MFKFVINILKKENTTSLFEELIRVQCNVSIELNLSGMNLNADVFMSDAKNMINHH